MKNKYFLAIFLPQPYLDEVEQIKQQLHYHFGLKGAMRSPSHITLHMPFELQNKNEPVLINSLKKIKFDVPIEIKSNGFSAFDQRVIFIDIQLNEALISFQKLIVKHLATNFNLENEIGNARGFHPHITVAFRDLKKKQFKEVKSFLTSFNSNLEFIAINFSILKLNENWQILESFPLSSSH
jgi:2'-5' RNA ligase